MTVTKTSIWQNKIRRMSRQLLHYDVSHSALVNKTHFAHCGKQDTLIVWLFDVILSPNYTLLLEDTHELLHSVAYATQACGKLMLIITMIG